MWVAHPEGLGLDCTVSLPLLPISQFFLYVFSRRRSFLHIFQSFPAIVGLWVAAIFVCPQEAVSSGPSYSATLAPLGSFIGALIPL